MMRDRLGPGTVLGYCTNVHPAATYNQLIDSLERYTLDVKARVSPDSPTGIGLWLSAQTARNMLDANLTAEFSEWLTRHGLFAYTLNGFPYGDFHRQTVKHRVYEPDWQDPRRLGYTLDLITILAKLLSTTRSIAQPEGSISTLPLGWRAHWAHQPHATQAAIQHLLKVVERLAQLEQDTGQLIHLDLEPEPGCVLQTSNDVVDLFIQHLDHAADPAATRRYLRVCHDTCHAAVMFEGQDQAMQRYHDAGIRIGKVQLSSAIAVPFDRMAIDDRSTALQQLAPFQEDRYLHQTVIQSLKDNQPPQNVFYEDLPDAIAAAQPVKHSDPPRITGRPWRVHFHVPLFVDRFGLLETTNSQITQCLDLTRYHPGLHHFEVETYAWNVLPNHPIDHTTLASGIARELTWVIINTAHEHPTRPEPA